MTISKTDAAAAEDVAVTTLSNGLRVVTDRMTSIASASVGVFVGAGARHERVEQNGVAHFLEHMAFKGTKTRSALAIAAEIEDVGGDINAYTSREITCYYARVLAENTGLALEILADITRNATMPEADIEVERGVILQEIGQALDTPDDIVFDWAQEKAFPDQAVGRPILGPADNIRRFDRAALQGFIAERYAPERIVVAAAGAVEHDAVVAMAERAFGDLAAGGAADAFEAAAYAGGDLRVEKDLEQAHVILGFETPGYLDQARFDASQIASTVLSGGMSSRLFQEIREKRGLCYAIFASPQPYAETGWTSIYADANGEDVTELLETVVDELKKAADGVTEAETARAQAQFRASLLMSLEAPSSRCQRIARALLAHGRVPSLGELLDRIAAVDAAKTRQAVATMIAGRPTATLYGPVAGAPDYDTLCSRLSA